MLGLGRGRWAVSIHWSTFTWYPLILQGGDRPYKSKVSCPRMQRNPVRVRTQPVWSRIQCTNHWATAFPIRFDLWSCWNLNLNRLGQVGNVKIIIINIYWILVDIAKHKHKLSNLPQLFLCALSSLLKKAWKDTSKPSFTWRLLPLLKS